MQYVRSSDTFPQSCHCSFKTREMYKMIFFDINDKSTQIIVPWDLLWQQRSVSETDDMPCRWRMWISGWVHDICNKNIYLWNIMHLCEYWVLYQADTHNYLLPLLMDMLSALYAIARPSVCLSDAFASPYRESMACRQSRRVSCSHHCSAMARKVLEWYE